MTKGLAAVSYSLFLKSLSEVKRRHTAIKFVYSAITASSVAGITASAVSLAQNDPLSVRKLPSNKFQRDVTDLDAQKLTWIILGAIEAAAFLALFSLNMCMIWTLQVPLKRKLTPSLWFSLVFLYVFLPLSGLNSNTDLPLSLVPVIIGRLVYTPTDLFRADFTFNTIDFFIFVTIKMQLAVINAAYPNLLAFVSKASTRFMNTTPGLETYGQHSTHSANRKASANHAPLKLRNDVQMRTTTIARGHQDDASVQSFNSQAIMVSKSVTVDGRDPSLPRSPNESE